MAESPPDPPEDAIERGETRWLMAMLALLAVMMAVVVATSFAHALHPPSNVEPIDPLSLHLAGEFVESNLGAAREADGSVTVRMLAQQYGFVPQCVTVPADTPVRFRLTSADVVHGFLLIDTNVNTMIVPGFVSQVGTRFGRPDDYEMPCHEYCGLGHQGMWAHVIVVPKDRFPDLGPRQRLRCAAH